MSMAWPWGRFFSKVGKNTSVTIGTSSHPRWVYLSFSGETGPIHFGTEEELESFILGLREAAATAYKEDDT